MSPTAASIPDWYIWAYYISPFSWGLRAIVINEMTAPVWSEPAGFMPGHTRGEAALLSFGFFTEK